MLNDGHIYVAEAEEGRRRFVVGRSDGAAKAGCKSFREGMVLSVSRYEGGMRGAVCATGAWSGVECSVENVNPVCL